MTWSPHTSFHKAVEMGNQELSLMLLQRGYVEINSKTQSLEYTALHLAVKNGHTKLIPLLLEYGADKNIKGGYVSSHVPVEMIFHLDDKEKRQQIWNLLGGNEWMIKKVLIRMALIITFAAVALLIFFVIGTLCFSFIGEK